MSKFLFAACIAVSMLFNPIVISYAFADVQVEQELKNLKKAVGAGEISNKEYNKRKAELLAKKGE